MTIKKADWPSFSRHLMYDLLRPLLFALDAETAHGLTLYGLDVAQRSELMRFVAKPAAELPQQEAIINRMGFNNAGVDALVRNVDKSGYRGVLGINIGKNKDTPNERAAEDYLLCLERVYAHAGYITVNISSPNTQGLRDLQEEATLRRFIDTLRERQEQL